MCLFVTRFPIPFFFYFSCISLGLTRAYRPHYIRFSFFAEKDVIYLFMRCEYHSFRVIINTSNEFHNTCHKKKCSHYIYIEQFCACYYFFFEMWRCLWCQSYNAYILISGCLHVITCQRDIFFFLILGTFFSIRNVRQNRFNHHLAVINVTESFSRFSVLEN